MAKTQFYVVFRKGQSRERKTETVGIEKDKQKQVDRQTDRQTNRQTETVRQRQRGG